MTEHLLTLHIEKLPEGVYLATSPDLQGLLAQGKTVGETIGIARDVAAKLLESYVEHGDTIPEWLQEAASTNFCVSVAIDGGQTDQLVARIGELEAFLRAYEHSFWADWIAQDAARIENGDAYGLDHLLSAFGGMGSLSDIMIYELNGRDLSPSDVDRTNAKLRELTARVYVMARDIQRDLKR